MYRAQNNRNSSINFKCRFCAILFTVFVLLTFSVSVISEESKQKLLKKTDAEILESLDTIKNKINNDLFLIEEENDMKTNDSFDNINLDSFFSDSKSSSNANINNQEEKTINKLDKSNLTDFEDGDDAWWSDLIEDVEIEDVD